jgi:hypothetical protein
MQNFEITTPEETGSVKKQNERRLLISETDMRKLDVFTAADCCQRTRKAKNGSAVLSA